MSPPAFRRPLLPSIVLFILGGLPGLAAASSGGSGTDVITEALDSAAFGYRRQLYAAARAGGDGAWFALAEAARHAGYSKLAENLLRKSYKKDPEPFAGLALSRLLIGNPRALAQPLAKLRRREKLFGPSEGIRQARVAVLSSLGMRRALVREMEFFTGRDWEAPVAAAIVASGRMDAEKAAVIQRFILHCSAPASLRILPPVIWSRTAPETGELLRARIAYSRGDYRGALRAYGRWLDLETRTAGAGGDEVPPVFAEIAHSARKTGEEHRWAEHLGAAASSLRGAKKYAAAYQAGKLLRELHRRREAAASFGTAVAASPNGLAGDRARWYGLRTMQEDPSLRTDQEVDAFSRAAEGWSDPHRFSDRLELFIHRRVRQGEWTDLEALYRRWGDSWPPTARAEAAWTLAAAGLEGRLPGGNTQLYLREAAAAAPHSWWGLRASGVLDQPIVLRPNPGRTEVGPEDLVARLFLKWGLTDAAAEDVLSSPNRYSDDTIRMAAGALATPKPRLSIRVAGLLWRRAGFSPTREDLLLRHPLPYGEEAGDAAGRRGVPEEVFFGLIRTESAWDTAAVSRSGAQGLTQFIPSTWAEWVQRLKYPPDADPMDPETNLEMGAAYLQWLADQHWTSGWIDVLASYNGGGGRVRGWKRERPGLGPDLFGISIPIEEPRSYIGKVLSAATMYGYLYANRQPRELHRSWKLPLLRE